MRTELFGHNVAGTALGSPLGNLSFYFMRLMRVDPLVALAGALSIIFSQREARPQRHPGSAVPVT